MSCRSLLATVALVGCLGPGEAERDFVSSIEHAAADVIRDEGATEATTRSLRAEDVAWIRKQHTVVVESTWPAGRVTASASIPVTVHFDQKDGPWAITQVTPDPVGMQELRARLKEAEARSASVRRRQAAYDAKVQRAHQAFTSAGAEGGLDGVLPDMKHIEIRNCLVVATVPPSWRSTPKAARAAQLDAVGEVWTGMLNRHGVSCGDPAFTAQTPGGKVLGTWRASRGSRAW